MMLNFIKNFTVKKIKYTSWHSKLKKVITLKVCKCRKELMKINNLFLHICYFRLFSVIIFIDKINAMRHFNDEKQLVLEASGSKCLCFNCVKYNISLYSFHSFTNI